MIGNSGSRPLSELSFACSVANASCKVLVISQSSLPKRVICLVFQRTTTKMLGAKWKDACVRRLKDGEIRSVNVSPDSLNWVTFSSDVVVLLFLILCIHSSFVHSLLWISCPEASLRERCLITIVVNYLWRSWAGYVWCVGRRVPPLRQPSLSIKDSVLRPEKGSTSGTTEVFGRQETTEEVPERIWRPASNLKLEVRISESPEVDIDFPKCLQTALQNQTMAVRRPGCCLDGRSQL